MPVPVEAGRLPCHQGASAADCLFLAYQRTSRTLCEPGHYCVAGVRAPCPAGTVGDEAGLSSCDKLCPGGYVCPAGSFATAPSDEEGNNVAECGSIAVWCGEGSSVPTVASAGYFTIGGSSESTRTGQEICTAG